MEVNLSSSLEKLPEEIVLWGSEGHGKSYTCTFCKRGFSNAQALGGHMNIHRKDRARLREEGSSSTVPETLFPLDITKKMDGSLSDHNKEESSSDEKVSSSTLKRPWVFVVEEDAAGISNPRRKYGSAGELTQLPLFVGAPSNDLEGNSFVVHGDGNNPLRAELDLELRLGPEHQSTLNRY